jgi:hypothetical protein
MPTSVIPALIDAIVATSITGLPDLHITDGWSVSDLPGDYLMIGVEDPDVDGYAETATSTQEWANANYTARNESGDINCVALSWNGDADAKAARDAVYANIAALETELRQNPPQGLDDVLWTSFGVSGSRLNQIQDGAGAVALLLFSIHFEARI